MMDLLTVNDRAGEYPPSYYAASANALDAFPALKGEIRADVCVVGAGYTGLNAALELAEAGFDVVLLDAQRVGWGASGRNGGQLGSGQRQDQDWIEKAVGFERAKAFWDLSMEAKATAKARIAKHAIACDLKPGMLRADHKTGEVAEHHAYVEKLNRDYGYADIRPLSKAEAAAEVGSRVYHGGSLDMGAGHLHPLNYALGLGAAARDAGVRIFERSRATRAVSGRVTTAEGAVTARYVLLACNGYLGDLVPKVAARVMPINNFIVATEPLSEALLSEIIPRDVCVADTRFVVNYFRLSADKRMLFGGGENYSYRFPRDIAAMVRPRMEQVYPQLRGVRVDHAWGGTLGITVNRMPAFQRLDGDVYSAAGYSGHGVAMATLGGKLMAEAIRGTAERFDVFAGLAQPGFPGGAALRWPILAAAMTWYSLRDRL